MREILVAFLTIAVLRMRTIVRQVEGRLKAGSLFSVLADCVIVLFVQSDFYSLVLPYLRGHLSELR